MGRELVELSENQLLKLAELIHLQEVQKLNELVFESYAEQMEYLNRCKEAFNKTNSLLKAVQTMKDKAAGEKDATKASIAHDIYEYASKGISTSLQFIRSYNSRMTFLDKLSAHSHDMIELLYSLDPATQIEEAKHLAEQALMYKEFILDYAKKVQAFVPNQFTRWINETGITLEELLAKYMAELGLEGSFKNLTRIQQLQVSEKVIEAAGLGRSVVTHTYEALGTVGVAVLVFTAATMVWDIFTAENKLEVAARDAVNVLTGVASLTIDQIATAAVAAGFEAASIEVASAMITVMGSIVGFGVGALIGVAAGALLDLIFLSGTTKVNTTDGLTACRVAPMPNGLELARLIKYNYPDL